MSTILGNVDSSSNTSDLNNFIINTIRCLAADMVQQAKSGHPGMPMGMAPIAHVLWSNFLNFSPENPRWFNRDRFVLSNGHGCALLYIMLHLTGQNMSMADLKQFRQLGSKTPGHPENTHTVGVEVTSGPLGQGISNAVGMAIALEHCKARFNTKDFPELIDNTIYVFCGDGCLSEGISSEASSLAGHLGLGSLIVIYDDNKVTIDGPTQLSFTENVGLRYESYGWYVQKVENGDSDLKSIEVAIAKAKAHRTQPNLIMLRTTIGYGSKKQGLSAVHGSALGEDDVANLKMKFGLDASLKFDVSQKVYDFYEVVKKQNLVKEKQWNSMFEQYAKAHSELAEELEALRSNPPHHIKDIEHLLPIFSTNDKPLATRKMSQMTLNKLAPTLTHMIGGSADLAASTFTDLQCSHEFQKGNYDGRILRFGVREHAMAAVANGIRAYGNFIPFVGTFLNFAGYALGAMRLSALSKFQVIYIMTHDSIGLGEDGPTHQPIETLASLRSIPNMFVFRPCDGNEVNGSYLEALHLENSPSVLALSRQEVPARLDGSSAKGVSFGAYTLQNLYNRDSEDKNLDLILIGTGSEVNLCVQAAKLLSKNNIRIVSMPCWELYERQSLEYKQSVFPDGIPIMSVEPLSRLGWERYSHYHFGISQSFGKSGPFESVYEYFGFTPKGVAEKAEKLISCFRNQIISSKHFCDNFL